jgi:hypothetical protein
MFDIDTVRVYTRTKDLQDCETEEEGWRLGRWVYINVAYGKSLPKPCLLAELAESPTHSWEILHV